MNSSTTKAYSVPFRVLWLQSQDVIELRITLSGRPKSEQILRMPITAHLEPASNRLLGLLIADSKTLRLGRWLRQNWSEVDHTPDEPVPSGVVVYDEGAQFAYFSVWPNLSGVEPERAERRRAEVVVNDENELLRLRLATSVRRGANNLAIAAGYLPTR